MNEDSLITLLRAIGLHYTAQTLPDLLARATKQRAGPREVIELFAKAGDVDRKRKSLERRSKRSRVGSLTAMADFDWNWPKKIDRQAVEEALALDFMPTNSNVVLVGAEGLGKTMIAQNIAHSAVLKGHAALFITAAQLLNDLSGQESARVLERRLRYYASLGVLCIDSC